MKKRWGDEGVSSKEMEGRIIVLDRGGGKDGCCWKEVEERNIVVGKRKGEGRGNVKREVLLLWYM